MKIPFLKECITCEKFNDCKPSCDEYNVAQKHFPKDTADDSISRADWMKEKFRDCKDWVKSGGDSP